MVLSFGLALPCVSRSLHQTDYSFEPRQLGRSLSKDRYDENDDSDEPPCEIAAPPQFFLVGFKDQDLETQYLEYLVDISRSRLVLGVIVALALYVACNLSFSLFLVFGVRDYFNLVSDTQSFHEFALPLMLMGFFSVGVVTIELVYRYSKRKWLVLYICEAVFLAYIIFEAWNMFLPEDDRLSKTVQDTLFGYGGFSIWLLVYRLPPFIVLFFINVPVLMTIEIVLGVTSAFIIAVPWLNGFWERMTTSSIIGAIGRDEELQSLCRVIFSDQMICASYFRYAYLLPIILTLTMGLTMVIVSYFVDRNNRSAFVNKKIIGALTRQREASLKKQKRDQENLIYSIFPRPVAQELIAAQSEEDANLLRSPRGSIKWASFGGSVARLHCDVTILFTDIVGFTAMSQTCPPIEVMQFLHNLFVEFDDLIDMDSHLWKVETIGDAFMVASGLNVGVDERETSSKVLSSSSVFSCKSADAPSTAKAAVHFGVEALRGASLHTMPNNEPCRIRVGAHTGDVCSGVVGSRMPRYCLFGDTVNTASRMESTGVADSMQISQSTHAIMMSGSNDDDAFVWEERGEVGVKGKGMMKTYMLTLSKEDLANSANSANFSHRSRSTSRSSEVARSREMSQRGWELLNNAIEEFSAQKGGDEEKSRLINKPSESYHG